MRGDQNDRKGDGDQKQAGAVSAYVDSESRFYREKP